MQSPRRRGSQPSTPRGLRPSPKQALSSPRDIVGRPPISSPQGSYNSPRNASLGGSLLALESPRLARSVGGTAPNFPKPVAHDTASLLRVHETEAMSP